jgi:hypothetical protein
MDCGDVETSPVGAPTRVLIGTERSLLERAAGTGVPAAGDTELDAAVGGLAPPVTLATTRAATTTTTKATDPRPIIRLRRMRASKAACSFAAWRSVRRSARLRLPGVRLPEFGADPGFRDLELDR